MVEITTPRTSDPWSFALSPDGRRLAFVADHEGQPTLWVRALDAAGAHALPGTEGARRPFWSPDSRSIGFFADSELKRIEARGGSAQTVTYALAGTNGRVGTGRDHPLLQHRRHPRCAASTPREGAWRRRRRRRRIRPATAIRSSCQEAGSSCSSSAARIAVRGVYLGLARVFGGDASRCRPTRKAAYVAPGWLLFIRQGTLLAQRFDVADGRSAASRSRSQTPSAFESDQRQRCVFHIERGSDRLPGRPAPRDTALVVRSIWQRAWHARVSRAVRPVDSQAVTGWASRGRRAHAPERDRPVAARFHAPDALHARRRMGRIARASPLVAGWRPDRIRIGRLGFGRAVRETLERRWRRRRAVRVAGGEDPLRLVARRPIAHVLRPRSEDGHRSVGAAAGTRVPFVFLKTAANELWGQFSPDGRWVAYQSNETGQI